MSFVSYAQNSEDVLLHRVFGGQETGFYVDVGAFHPVIGSVTKVFYDRGWSGINVEPGSVFAELAKARPRDVNLRMAVLDRAGEIAFVEDEADLGMSRVIMDEGHAESARMVPCDTLQAIVDAHSHGRPVDFIKIDVEGAEAAIVHATDWRRLRPRVLLLEATRPWSSMLSNQDWEPVLLQQGYVRAYFDGINCFYIPEEEAPVLLRHFQVPVNVLDRAEPHDTVVLRDDLRARQAEVAHLTIERDTARKALDEKFADAVRLTDEREALRKALDDKHADAAAVIAARDILYADLQGQQAVAARLTAERDAVRTALDEKFAEAGRLAAERDAVRTALDEKRAEAGRLASERDALRTALDETVAQAARLTAERDALRTALDETVAQAAGLAKRMRILEAQLAPPPPPPPPPPPVVVAPPRLRKRVARRVAKAAYRLVRPVVRPALWRLRTFMTGDLIGQIGRLDQRVEALGPAGPPAAVQPAPPPPTLVHVRDDGAAAEMRRLAAEMERALLTLALERAPEPWGVAPPSSPEATPATAPEAALGPAPARLALLLPHGRTTQVAHQPGDLSVAASLAASGGDWEPHVRAYMARTVQPDWVCLDIGANLGVHTLSLAVLAHEGRVVAFEADATNFALLSGNADALAVPRATISLVNLALWDRPGTLVFGGADELAGCSFVAEALDAEKVERQLRMVVDAGAIDGVDLHIRSGSIAALPLDAWVDAQDLPRLDLIKLDVEGAEARIIRGADATLRRFRPVLLVEYNPACAAAYFGQPPEELFEELAKRFVAIHALELDGTLTPLADWPALQARLATGRGWEDLVCLPEPLVA